MHAWPDLPAVVRIMHVLGAPHDASDRDLVDFARRSPNKFAPTLFSAWRRAGIALSPPLAYELDLYAARAREYAKVASELAELGATIAAKGQTTAALYPDGLRRQTSDLDVVVLDEASLWRCAIKLVESGWRAAQLTVLVLEGEARFLLVFARPNPDPMVLGNDRIELLSFATFGDFWGFPPMSASVAREWTPKCLALVLLVVEGVERQFGARDVVDATLLCAALDAEEVQVFTQCINRLQLMPEWLRLISLIERADIVLRDPFPPGAASTHAARRARIIRAARGTAGSVRVPAGAIAYVQRAAIRRRDSSLQRMLKNFVAHRASARGAMAAGLPVFGVRLQGQPTGDLVSRFEHHSKMSIVKTPVGDYGLFPTDSIDERDLAGRSIA